MLQTTHLYLACSPGAGYVFGEKIALVLQNMSRHKTTVAVTLIGGHDSSATTTTTTKLRLFGICFLGDVYWEARKLFFMCRAVRKPL
jgi:hypothetical protein